MAAKVHILPSKGAEERVRLIEALFCDLESIGKLQHLAADGEHYTPARDWLNRQSELHLEALEKLVMPQHE